MPDDIVPPIVAPPPPPPSEATRRAIFPTPESPAPSLDLPTNRNRVLIVGGTIAAIALVALAVAVVAGRDNGRSNTSTGSGPEVDPASASPANVQPGRPPGVDDPPAPRSASPMVGLRHDGYVGFERVSVDFGDTLPPRIQTVETDVALGRIRVVLDQPRPTEATAPERLDVASAVVRSVFFVVDADRTYVDVFTNQAADAFAFRLANVAFKDGSTRSVIVIDVVP